MVNDGMLRDQIHLGLPFLGYLASSLRLLTISMFESAVYFVQIRHKINIFISNEVFKKRLKDCFLSICNIISFLPYYTPHTTS